MATQKELDEIKAELGMLEHTLKTLVDAAKLDGEIDDEEQNAIDDMEQCIRVAKRKRDDLAGELGGGDSASGASGTSSHSHAEDSSDGKAPDYSGARIIDDGKKYTYAKFPDGRIFIKRGPDGQKDFLVKPNTKAWEAIDNLYGGAAGQEAVSEETSIPDEQEKVEQQEAYNAFVEGLAAPVVEASASVEPLPTADGGPVHHNDGEPSIDPDYGADFDTGLEGAMDESRRLNEIQQRQIDLQAELLANPDRADAILAKLEEANRTFYEAAGLPEDPSDSYANDTSSSHDSGSDDAAEEDASLGQDLLELHRDLYQEFLNAGDPLNPDLITAGQEAVLEEMRIVNEELAIEAERSVLAHKFDATDGLDGEELVDEYQRSQYEEDGDYNEDLNYETPDDETDDGPATSTYDEMRHEGIGNEDASVDELLLDGLSEENRLLMHGELDQEMIDARIQQIRKLRGLASGVKINVTMDGDRIVGFNYDGEINDGKEWGKLYLDLNGNQIARDWDTTSIPGEVLFLGIEIASSILVPPIEVLYDVRDLYDATLEYSQAEDGSVVPLIVTATAVLVPRMMGSKRFFKIGKHLVEASKLASVIKKGVTGEALEGIGITAAQREGRVLDDLLENAEVTDESSDLARRLADDPEINQQAIREAIDAAQRGMAEEIAGGIVQKADPYKDFLERKSVKDVLKRMEDEGVHDLKEIGVTPKQLRDWVGEGTDEDIDWAQKMLRDRLQNKLDDRAFDDMIDPDELTDDWLKNTKPDVEKKYDDPLDTGVDPDDLPDEFLDILDAADPANMSDEARQAATQAWVKKYGEMLEAKGVDTAEMSEEAIKKAATDLEKDYYDALRKADDLGFAGTPKQVKAGLKRLKTLVAQGMQKEFKKTWAENAASSKAAQRKMEWVDKYHVRLSDIADKLEGLDPASDQATRLFKQAEETRKHMNEIARSAFDNVRSAFWREVNGNSRDILESAGLKVKPGGSAPVLESIGQSITIEHKDRLKDAPWRAIDADNMTFAFSYENSVLLEQQRKLIEDRMRELGHDGAAWQ